MKRIFFTVGILFFCVIILAQKSVNVDNLRFDAVYRAVPNQPQNPLFFYYSTGINASKSMQRMISLEEIDNALFIEGQRKDQDLRQGDLLIGLTLGDIIIQNATIKNRKVEKKDKEGRKFNVNYYWLEVEYTFSSGYTVTKGSRVLLQATVYPKNSSFKYKSSEYDSGRDANAFWDNNRAVLISGFVRELALKTANDASNAASLQFGFPVVRKSDIVKTINEKKHAENDAFRAAASRLKAELESMTPEMPADREVIHSLIDYFNNIPVRYSDPGSKADARLRYAAYYNLCKIYLYLDEPENVGKYASLILTNGEDKKDCDRMNKAAGELRGILFKTIVKTRHFNPDDYFE